MAPPTRAFDDRRCFVSTALMHPALRRRVAGWLALASIGGVLLATLSPWLGIAPMRIPTAWCLLCGGAWLMDAVSNVLLFLPVGAALALHGWPVRRIVLLAFALSLFVETMQSYGIPPSRSPSASDSLTNTVGSLLGAVLVNQWRSLWDPTPALARRLAGAWACLAAMAVILTAAALAPRHSSVDGPGALHPSRFAYAPGYGWYGGRLDAVTINAQAIPHDGDGPVVIEGERLPTRFEIGASLQGRDTAWYTRAMVFLHTAQDTLPAVSLSQRGDHLELHIERRGSDWGLYMPYVRLADVLRGRRAVDTTRFHIAGIVSPGQLSLTMQSPGRMMRVSRELPPTIGWTMLQNVIGLTHPLGPFVQLLWLLVLCAPIGWWSGRSPRPLVTMASGAGLLAAGVASAAWWIGLPIPGAPEWMTLGVMMIAACAAARRASSLAPRTGPGRYILS